MKSRAREIGRMMMMSSQGGTFPCHKSVDYNDVPEDPGESRIPAPTEVHCAGALIFAEATNPAGTQMMRISERFGEYDRTKFTDEVKSEVFRTYSEFVAANGKTRKV